MSKATKQSPAEAGKATPVGEAHRTIHVRGAREHNLKNVDLEIPRDALIVFTRLSGSGKSSLAFDTIHAEGQRRYVECLSAYARSSQMMQAGLSPSTDIAGHHRRRHLETRIHRGTVTVDYLRPRPLSSLPRPGR
jgi:excinuclease ABC subunit A